MHSWNRDTSGRLVRSNSANLIENPSFEFSVPSHTPNQMADQGSNHDLNENESEHDAPMRPLRDYLQPAHTSTPSCIILPL